MSNLRRCAPQLLRFQTQNGATRRCSQCMKRHICPFITFRSSSQSSKRPLMTESAHRTTSTLEPSLTPPRNAGIPDTTIASDRTAGSSWPPSSPWQRQGNDNKPIQSEAEAQKSQPTLASQSLGVETQNVASPNTAPDKPRKSKLRPRKAAMVLTPKAVEKLKELFDQPESKLIRVGVKNRGCSGLAYHLEYVDKAGAFDESVEQDGVKVLVDSKALFSIIGSEMDWLEDKLSARFIFKNPNISKFYDMTQCRGVSMVTDDDLAEQCGCGESFSIS